MRRIIPWIICLLSVLCAIIAIDRYRRIRTESDLAEIQIARLFEQTKNLQSQLSSAEKAREDAERLALESKVAVQAGATQSARRRLPSIDGLEMLKNPAYAPLWRRLERRADKQVFRDIVAAMKLPAAEEARLWDLIEERSESIMDAAMASKQANLSSQDTEKTWHSTEDDANDQIRMLIGPDNFKMLKLCDGFGSPGMLVTTSIGGELSRAGSPLTPDQLAQVAQAYSEAHMAFGQASGVTIGQVPDPVTGLTPFYQALLDSVAKNLTPDQIAVVKDYYQEQVQVQLYKEEQATHTQ